MATRGRKPKPTRLKMLQGTVQKCRSNPSEPTPENKIPDCPDHLTTDAKKEWARITPVLLNLGLLTELDRAALAIYCSAWAEEREAVMQIRADGYMVKTDFNGLQKNPFVAQRNRAREQVKSFLVEFGLSPSSRCRVSGKPTAKKSNPFSKI